MHIVEDNIDITESDSLVDFTIEDNCYINDKFVGTTVAKKIMVNMLNPNNLIDLENKEIQIFVGMMINDVKEEVPFGNFIIPKANSEEIKEKTYFVGYDYMIKFDIPYKSTVTYPCKAKELFQNLCGQVGLVAGNIDFANCDYTILGNPFTNNETCRVVLSNLAQLAGGFAKIGRDNKVYIISLSKDNVVETIDGNNYFDDFSKNNQWGELNSLVLRISGIEGENTTLQDDTSVEQNGLTELIIEDNDFLIDQAEREKVINPLWNKLKGIKYMPFKASYYGYPYLDSGDKVRILDSQDNEYESYVFNHIFTFNGSYSGSIETNALTKTQTAYKNTDSTKIKFRQIERKINKIDGIIEDVIEEVDENSEKMTQVLQTVDEITQKVENIADLTKTVTGLKTITIEDAVIGAPIEIKILGNNTVFKKLYFDGSWYFDENHYFTNENSAIFINDNVYDLGIDEVLRQYKDVYDEYIYNYTENTAKVIRRVGIDGVGNLYVLPNEIVENISVPNFELKAERNVITIPNYSANMSITYIPKNEYTNIFATRIEMKSSIEQSAKEIDIYVNEKITTAKGDLEESIGEISVKADEINQQVKQKVGNNEIIASINTAVKNGQGIINISGNQVIIESDKFHLTKDGMITATAGKIAGLLMSTNALGNSFLYKNYSSGNKNYQSGLYIPNSGTGSEVFIYAGIDVTSGSSLLSNANFYVRHDGNAYARNLNIISDGALYFWYGNGKVQASYSSNYITRYNENGNRWIVEGRGFVSGVATAHVIWIHDAQYYQIQDGIHNKTIVNFKRINDSASSNLDAEFYSDIHVWGTRQTDGINNSIYIRGYEVATNASDKRLKENVENSTTNALDIIKRLRIRQFDWRRDIHTKDAGSHVDIGYIAQEVQQISSQLVNYSEENDTYQMNLLNLSSLHTKAIQEQDKKIVNLEKENQSLKATIEELLKRIEKLESKEELE